MSEAIIPFSVVIPLYNKEATIDRAIRSVLNQTVQDFEIIVVNDGSTDNSASVVESISDPRIHLINQNNQGVSTARNRGIAKAQHELIAFLDADDEWLPEFLETIRKIVIRYPDCGLYATSYFLHAPYGKQDPAIVNCIPDAFVGILENYFEIVVSSHPPVWSSATCARKSALTQIGGFPIGVKSGEDLLTWARIAIKNNIAYSSDCCAIYHLSTSQTYEAPPSRIPDNDDVVGRGLAELLNIVATDKRVYLRRYCALWHKMRASDYLRLGMKTQARREIFLALHYEFMFRLIIYLVLSFYPTKFTLKFFRLATANR